MQNNYTITNLQMHYTQISRPFLDELDKLVQRNRESEVAADGSVKSKTVSAEERAQFVEDPCVKKVRMLNGIQHVCKFLESSQVKCMATKLKKLETEDKFKALNHAAMEKEAGLLVEIRNLEEMAVKFNEEKNELEEKVGELDVKLIEEEKILVEMNEKRQFYIFRMQDKLRSLNTLQTVEKNACSSLQEQSYMSRGEYEKEAKENSRLRLYLQTCKDNIEAQFPKPEIDHDHNRGSLIEEKN